MKIIKILFCVLFVVSGLFGDSAVSNKTNQANKITESEKSTTHFLVGVGIGFGGAEMKNITESAGVQKTAINKHNAFGGGILLGVSNVDKFLGGRFYAEVSYLKIPKFDLMNMGLNLDMLINFVPSQFWNIGAFVGIGGGMYVATPNDSALSSAGKVPLSPAGWLNIGARISIGSHEVDVLYRMPYVYTSIYNENSLEVVNGVNRQRRNGYHLKMDFVAINYIFSF